MKDLAVEVGKIMHGQAFKQLLLSSLVLGLQVGTTFG